MLVSTKVANLFKHCGFVNIDYLLENKIYVSPSVILNILEKEFRKWKKPLCMQGKTMFDGGGLDPTFGYTEIGSDSLSINKLGATKFDCPESGTADSMSFYWSLYDTGKKARMAIYNDDGGSPSYPSSRVAQTELQSSNTEGSPHWETLNFTDSPSLSAQTYWLAFQTDWGSIKYDAGDADQTVHGWISQDDQLTMPDPYPSGQDSYAYKCSIYCSYTVSGGGLSVPVAMHHYSLISNRRV